MAQAKIRSFIHDESDSNVYLKKNYCSMFIVCSALWFFKIKDIGKIYGEPPKKGRQQCNQTNRIDNYYQ